MQGTGDQDTAADCSSQNSSLTSTGANLTAAMPAELKKPRFSISVYFWLLCSTLVVSFVSFLILDLWPSFRKEKLDYIRKRKRQYDEPDENASEEFIKHHDSKDKQNEEQAAKGSTLDKMVLLLAITLVSFILYGFVPGLSSYR